MVTFNKLWNNHPTISDGNAPCTVHGVKQFSNQCAISLGVALSKSGVDTSKIPGIRYCWHHDKKEGHILSAEELAKGLTRTQISGIQSVKKLKPENFNSQISGSKGIIFFKDYWQRKNEKYRNRSGDHIDLWDGSKLTSLSSWFRINMRFRDFGLHSISDQWSDFEDSREIWFWRVS